MKYPTEEVRLKTRLLGTYLSIYPQAKESDVREAGYGDAVDFFGSFEKASIEARKGMLGHLLDLLKAA